MNKISIVLVLYQEKISSLPVLPILQQLAEKNNFQIIFFDNSPEPQLNPLREATIYHHDGNNPGLAAAYNFAWQKAQEFNATGLLLLDDDTKITKTYLEMLAEIELDSKIGAVVPQIYAGEKLISPVFATQYINRDSQFPSAGLITEHVMAINSGTFLPLPVLKKIGGFNAEFPLDFLDHWLFWRLYQENFAVKILPVSLQHQLSVLDYSQVSLARYQNILQAENKFYQKYQTELSSAHTKQLKKRLLKQFLTVKNRAIWRQTWATIRNRQE